MYFQPNSPMNGPRNAIGVNRRKYGEDVVIPEDTTVVVRHPNRKWVDLSEEERQELLKYGITSDDYDGTYINYPQNYNFDSVVDWAYKLVSWGQQQYSTPDQRPYSFPSEKPISYNSKDYILPQGEDAYYFPTMEDYRYSEQKSTSKPYFIYIAVGLLLYFILSGKR